MEMSLAHVHSPFTLERFQIQMSLKFGTPANHYSAPLICIKTFGGVEIWQKLLITVPFSVMDMNLQRVQSLMLQNQNHSHQVFRLPHDLRRYNARFYNWVPFSARLVFPGAVQSLPFAPMGINLQRMQMQSHILQAEKPKLEVPIPLPPHNLSRQGKQQKILCKICDDNKRRNISAAPFHCCVEDEVTLGFRGPSPAGPIERPRKS